MDKFSEKIDRIAAFLLSKATLRYLITFILFIFFWQSLKGLINDPFVKYGFSKITSYWVDDTIFTFIALLICLYFIDKTLKKYVPSNHLVLISFFLTIIYTYFRVNTANNWIYVPFSFSTNLFYTDIFYLQTVGIAILFAQSTLPKPENQAKPEAFIEDLSLGNNKEDELGYSPYVINLTAKIMASHVSKSFAIGVNGRWGSGKTSFFDLIKRELKNKEVIYFDFNPWNSQTPKAIIQDFFDTIQEKIRPYYSSLAQELLVYSNKLLEINDTKVSKSIIAGIGKFVTQPSLTTLHFDINESLRKTNRKIIVFIDDLDRLDKEEVVEVIRLIRNTANFHNTFFIVGYDRNYVLNALKGHNAYNHEYFLEKIFQVEINLPFFKSDKFRYKLAILLKNAFPLELHPLIDEEIIGTPSVTPTYLNEWLQSIRDVTRLTNAVTLNYQKLLGEVDLSEVLRLELLRLKFPSIYELVFKQADTYLKTVAENNERMVYVLEKTSKGEILLTEELVHNRDKYGFSEPDIEKASDLISGIFSSSFFTSESTPYLSVRNPSRFNMYFAYNLSEGNLSEIAFVKAREGNRASLFEAIDDWLTKDLEFEIHERLGSIKQFASRNDFEQIIAGIMYFANKKPLFNISNRDFIGFDQNNLLDKLYYNNAIKNFYNSAGDLTKLVEFLMGLLKPDGKASGVNTALINYFDSKQLNDFPLKTAVLKDLALAHFTQYCAEETSVGRSFYGMFYNCFFTVPGVADHNGRRTTEPIPEAVTLFKEFVAKKDFNTFLCDLIEHNPYDQKFYKVSEIAIPVYGSMENFKVVLDDADETKWSYLKEFKEFLKVFEADGNTKMVKYDFKTIPVEGKIRK
jgi:hypothetical protein